MNGWILPTGLARVALHGWLNQNNQFYMVSTVLDWSIFHHCTNLSICEAPPPILRHSSRSGGWDETAGPPLHTMRGLAPWVSGVLMPLAAPLILISSYNWECGSRIVAFKVISTEDLCSFSAPLHTCHRNMGNNRDAQRPIIMILAHLCFFCFVFLFSFFDNDQAAATKWLPDYEL